jgi:flagellar operon protein
MSDAIRGFDPHIHGLRPTPDPAAKPATPAPSAAKPFSEVLRQTLEQHASAEVRFSTHALDRLRERHVHLTGRDLEQIRDAVDRAAAKGSRESLLLKSDLALVVNVRNRTVITAMPGVSMREHLFTNIDSAVFLK